MKVSTSITLLFLLQAQLSSGFAPSPSNRGSLPILRAESGEESKPRTKPMSPEEIKARMREKQGLPAEDDEEEAPKLFAESLYDDIQATLLVLEKRVKEGPGSLSMLEVEDMVGQTQRILAEMKDFEAGRVNELSNAAAPAAPALEASAPVATPTKAGVAETAAVEEEGEGEVVYSHTDEGPAYEGSGGLGMAKGTRNTYVIPGMDEMSPEEYQKALQQSLVDRQKQRTTNDTNYGNRATWNYLNNLTGESGVLKDSERAP